MTKDQKIDELHNTIREYILEGNDREPNEDYVLNCLTELVLLAKRAD